MKINKKGDIGITLLVVGTFAICTFALLTFFTSNFSTSNSFGGLSSVNQLNSMVEENNFYKAMEINKDVRKTFFELEEIEGKTKFYLEKKAKKFVILSDKMKLIFSVEYPFS